MTQFTTTLRLSSEEDTAHLGRTLSAFAQPGDCILLRGQIGAGKSALARAFIRARLGEDTEVPSPTFTLVQTYEHDDVELWHADLYRLTDPQELIELGLIDAMEDQICLIEWPELLGDDTPTSALDILLKVLPDAHLATLTYGDHWHSRVRGIDQNA